jgi:hypothetical protein
MFDFDDPKNWSALLIGLLMMALGIIPLLNSFDVIGFGGFLSGILPKIATYLLAAGGIYLLIDSFMEDDHWRVISIIVALSIIAIGIIQILASFNIIGFSIPFITDTVYYVLFVIEGFFLVMASFVMF